jgi:hypothetical protein
LLRQVGKPARWLLPASPHPNDIVVHSGGIFLHSYHRVIGALL